MRFALSFAVLIVAQLALIGQANTWIPVANFPASPRSYSVSFSINNEGYVGLGAYHKDLWKFNPVTNSWAQCADFTGSGRHGAVAFTIGGSAYVGTGTDSLGDCNDFYKYDAITNQWTAIANFPGTARRGAVAFNIGNRGYVGTGVESSFTTYFSDMWLYNPLTNTWSSIAPLPSPRTGCACFTIGSCGYITGGTDMPSNSLTEMWRYDPALNAWLPCTDLLFPPSAGAFAFSINGQGYYGCGWDGNVLTNGVRKYNPVTDSWCWVAGYPGGYVSGAAAFVCNDTAYVGLGDWSWADSSFWKFYPSPDVGMQEQESTILISAYPNPATDVVQITLDGVQAGEFVKIKTYDASGRLVRIAEKKLEGINLLYHREQLPAGQYFLEFASGEIFLNRIKIVFQ